MSRHAAAAAAEARRLPSTRARMSRRKTVRRRLAGKAVQASNTRLRNTTKTRRAAAANSAAAFEPTSPASAGLFFAMGGDAARKHIKDDFHKKPRAAPCSYQQLGQVGIYPRLRTSSELFVEITRFIWEANPSYDVYQEFTKRHFQVDYKVHELISARMKIEEEKKQSAAPDDLPGNARHSEGGLFKRLFWGALVAAKARGAA